jgi:methionine-gamma-lyase
MSEGTPKGLSTLAVSAGSHASKQESLGPHNERAHVAPIFLTSTYEYENAVAADAAAAGEAYIYSRYANPSVEEFEQAVATLEGAQEACAFSSGMGALSSTLLALAQGGPILVSDGIYGGTTEFVSSIGTTLGMPVSFAPAWDTKQVLAKLAQRPKVLLVESISNPLLRVADLQALASACKQFGVAFVVDATFSTPCLNRPLDYGATAVVHSASKYLSGHGDVIAGIVSADSHVLSGIKQFRKLLGSNLGPFDAFLALRGLRTLPLRMERQCANALQLAERLSVHKAVRAVHYPGLESHPDHARALKLLRSGGAMVTFELDSLQAARSFYDRIKLIRRAASLGDVASLVTHPVSFSHKGVAESVRLAAGITDGLMRVSVGIEDIADLIADVDQALAL